MELKERFLKYVALDTQSCEESESYPSTDKQRVLLDLLADEMRALGLQEVTVDAWGYAMGSIPATPGFEQSPVLGLIAHVDTSPDMSGCGVKPRVIENYYPRSIAEGKKINWKDGLEAIWTLLKYRFKN